MTYRDRPLAPGSGSRAMIGERYVAAGRAARNPWVSARCWNAGVGSPRPGLLVFARDVPCDARELVVFGVECAGRRRQPEDAGEPALLIEYRRRDAAEVDSELLAIHSVTVGADPVQLAGELIGVRDRVRGVAREAAGDVARQRRRAQAGEDDLAHRKRVRVVGDPRAEAGHAGDALTAAHHADLDRAGAHHAEVAALARAQEQVVDGVLEGVAIGARRGRGDLVPGPVQPALVGGEAFVDETREQVIGGRRALADDAGDLVGAHAIGVLLEEAQRLQDRSRGREAAPAGVRPCVVRHSGHWCCTPSLPTARGTGVAASRSV